MRKPFYKFYWKVQGLIVPGLLISQYPYKDTLKNYINENTQWLDLGCGHQLLPRYMPSSKEEELSMIESIKMIVGIDYCYDSLQKHRTIKYKNIGDIENLPFKDNSFNLITANMVVEHIENPTPALDEVFRILKPKGIFIFHTTNVLNYQTFLTFLIPDLVKNKLIEFLEGRKEEDVFPAYYRMNSRKKNKAISTNERF